MTKFTPPIIEAAATAPPLASEVVALLGTAGCKAEWQGDHWRVLHDGRFFHVNAKVVSVDQWRATLGAVVDAG